MELETNRGEHQLYHKWEIDDFISMIERPNFTASKNRFFQSPSFSVEGAAKNLWYLRLSQLRENSIDKEWLSLSLASHSKNTKPTRASCIVFILTNNQRKKFTQIFCSSFESSHIHWRCEKFVEKSLLIDKRDEFLPNNMLTIGIELTIFDGPISVVEEPESISKCTIIDDLRYILQLKIDCDVTLLVGDQRFSAHKAILISRSPVFCKWLLHPTKEQSASGNELLLSNVDVRTCKMMLEFIYTDNVVNLENNVENLLAAADAYQLKGLKEICEEVLSESITVENVARIMVLAYRHSAKLLFDYAIDFGAINIGRVMKTGYYVDVIKFYPLISTTLIEKLARIIAVPSSPQTPEVMKYFSQERKYNVFIFSSIILKLADTQEF